MTESIQESNNYRIICNSINSIARMNRATNHLIEINQLTDERIDAINSALERIVLLTNLDTDSVHAGDKHNLLILIKDAVDLLKLIKVMPSGAIIEKIAELAMLIIEIPE